MIRHAISSQALQNMINQHDDGWMARAEERTQICIRQGKFKESSSIWSEVKPVYMEIQSLKCIFCERALGGVEYSRVEHDLEHFRPKGKVKAWPSRTVTRKRGIAYRFGTGSDNATGYYWLAYNIYNYAASCKTCNSTLKSDNFPISGTRATVPAANPRSYAAIGALNRAEMPYLLFPLGSQDVDPEALIEFYGITARPKKGLRQTNRRRARLTIDFFELNERPELQSERLGVIREMWLAFDVLENPRSSRQKRVAQTTINTHISDASPHASCARSFKHLYEGDPQEAWDIFEAAGP